MARDRPGRPRVLPRPKGLDVGLSRRTLGAFLVVLGSAVLIAVIASQWSMIRRAAEAPVTIESALFQPGGGTRDRQERGYHLRYTYAVDGAALPGLAFVPWDDVAAHHPKVCYVPSDPHDHRLVDGSVTCGTGGFLR